MKVMNSPLGEYVICIVFYVSGHFWSSQNSVLGLNQSKSELSAPIKIYQYQSASLNDKSHKESFIIMVLLLSFFLLSFPGCYIHYAVQDLHYIGTLAFLKVLEVQL